MLAEAEARNVMTTYDSSRALTISPRPSPGFLNSPSSRIDCAADLAFTVLYIGSDAPKSVHLSRIVYQLRRSASIMLARSMPRDRKPRARRLRRFSE